MNRNWIAACVIAMSSAAPAVSHLDFGVLKNGVIAYAPPALEKAVERKRPDGTVVTNRALVGEVRLVTNDYWLAGWRSVVDVPPPCDSNHYAVAEGWMERGENWLDRTYAIRELPPPPPRKFSKLKIYGAIVALPERNGVTAWETVKAWLEAKEIGGVNGWTAFTLAQEVSEDHPLFAPLAQEARVLLGLTEEQFAALLNECILED